MARIVGTSAGDLLTGTPNADQIYGYGGEDEIYGRDGNDLLSGGSGADLLVGEGGDDRLLGAAGNDALYGRLGNDILNGGMGADRLAGGAGNDTYIVDNNDDRIVEWRDSGFDRVVASVHFFLDLDAEVETLAVANVPVSTFIMLYGNRFAQTLIGHEGSNSLIGGGGGDTMYGFGGADSLTGGDGRDRLFGGKGDDNYWVNDPNDIVVERAGEGEDWVIAATDYRLSPTTEIEWLTLAPAGSGSFNLTGNGFDQGVLGNDYKNVLNGAAGDDELAGRGGNDRLIGGLGKDELAGGAGDDILYVDNAGDTVFERAGEGKDRVVSSVSYTIGVDAEIEFLTTNNSAGAAAIHLNGNAFAQTIIGNAGGNNLYGHGGDDILRGMKGFDSLFGGKGADRLDGGDGNDLLRGGDGNDLLRGGAGSDKLTGGDGRDQLFGGAGRDFFTFDAALTASNVDRIADFDAADDTIRLDHAVFAALSPGALAAAAFKAIGNGAIDADDRVIYNPATGALSYDADGSGAAHQRVLFATLTGAPAITAADFVVI